jgi:nucleoside-diphosphate-sugar epimerase
MVGFSSNMVDVRDVALGHALALERPEASGERFIVSNGPFFWAQLRKLLIYLGFLRNLCWLRLNHLPCDYGYFPPTWDNEGDAAINAGVKGIAPGTPEGFVPPQPDVVIDGGKATRVLGLQYRPNSETAVDAIKTIYELFPEAIRGGSS